MYTVVETPTFVADANDLWSEEDRGGVRIIYFTRLANGEIWLLVIYAKNVRGNIPAHILKAIREAIEDD